jgi:hypothetical protein
MRRYLQSYGSSSVEEIYQSGLGLGLTESHGSRLSMRILSVDQRR